MLGPSKVVIFVVTYKLVVLPMDLAYMGTIPFMSAFGEAKARQDWNWIKGAFKKATFASIALGIPFAAALALVAKPLILVWAGPSAVPDTYLVLWLFIYTVAGVSLIMSGMLLTGVERLEPLAVCITLGAFGCVGFGVLFTPWWGLSGLAFAMALSNITTFWPIQVYEVRRIFRAANAVPPTP